MAKKIPDVIGIGAINYDYIFHLKSGEVRNHAPGGGIEYIGQDAELVEEKISELYASVENVGGNLKKDIQTQVGGAAFLAMKAIHATDPKLQLAYVGVCGILKQSDLDRGFRMNAKNEFICIDEDFRDADTSRSAWLFFTKEEDELENDEERYIGKAWITLQKHKGLHERIEQAKHFLDWKARLKKTDDASIVEMPGDSVRNKINISPGANSLLLRKIEEREREKPGCFVRFLASARWIHISSLHDFQQFKTIMDDYVLKAKAKNRFLRLSFDPGSAYTREHKAELQRYLREFDYVFLSEGEFLNLTDGKNISEDIRYKQLMNYLEAGEGPVTTRVLVMRNKRKYDFVRFDLSKKNVRTKRIPWLRKFTIYDDTGAGDYFEGGFIAAMLSGLVTEPAANEVGAEIAITGMSTRDKAEVINKMNARAQSVMMDKYTSGSPDWRDRVYALSPKIGLWLAYILGIIAVIASVIDLITKIRSL